MKIRTLILPVAGLGKRLRPLTYTTPKNLIEVNGTPLIEYALKEAAQAGISRVITVVSPEHRAQYEKFFENKAALFPGMEFHVREQANPWGDGHAVLMAEDLAGDEPFAVRFCDDVIVDARPTLPRLTEQYDDLDAPVIFLERVPKESVSRYGVVAAEEVRPQIHRITGAVEKPAVEEAPSNLIIIGGYALSPEIMDRLRAMGKGMNEEADALRISHALAAEAKEGRPLFGWEFPGVRLDCGTLDGLAYAELYLKNAAGVESHIPAPEIGN